MAVIGSEPPESAMKDQRQKTPRNQRTLPSAAVQTSARMKRVRRTGTLPELAVREIIAAELGTRFEINCRQLPGTPDISSLAGRWAIFVHGCFWHSHRGCGRATIPVRNAGFWQQKFAANRERDVRCRKKLKQMGFRVLIVWECQVRDKSRLKKRLLNFLNSMYSACSIGTSAKLGR